MEHTVYPFKFCKIIGYPNPVKLFFIALHLGATNYMMNLHAELGENERQFKDGQINENEYNTRHKSLLNEWIDGPLKTKKFEPTCVVNKPKETDLYEFLQLELNATKVEISSSYRKLAMKYHPDKDGSIEIEEWGKLTKVLQYNDPVPILGSTCPKESLRKKISRSSQFLGTNVDIHKNELFVKKFPDLDYIVPSTPIADSNTKNNCDQPISPNTNIKDPHNVVDVK